MLGKRERPDSLCYAWGRRRQIAAEGNEIGAE